MDFQWTAAGRVRCPALRHHRLTWRTCPTVDWPDSTFQPGTTSARSKTADPALPAPAQTSFRWVRPARADPLAVARPSSVDTARFVTAHDLSAIWQASASRLERRASWGVSLIVDEIGYLPLDERGATVFFQLVSARYERGSSVLTSNKTYSDWGMVFGDQIIATAILDRLLHHSTTVNIRGESYRLKDRKKAGLLAPPHKAPAEG